MPRQWRAICSIAARISPASAAAASRSAAAGRAISRDGASATAVTGFGRPSITAGSGKASPGARMSTMVGTPPSSAVLSPTEPCSSTWSESAGVSCAKIVAPRGSATGSASASRPARVSAEAAVSSAPVSFTPGVARMAGMGVCSACRHHRSARAPGD